jgi:hypothetical protein
MDSRDTYPPDGWTKVLLPTTSAESWAAQRLSVNHPSFPQPEPNARVWRYMNFAQFVSFLSTKALYFSRLDRLGDDSEGTIPRGGAASLRARVLKVTHDGPPAPVETWNKAWISRYEQHRWSVFVNCWNCKKQESDQMWSKYSARPFGVAIRSTYERLNASLPLAWNSREVLLGQVTYGDYASADYVRDVSNHYNIVMSKRLEHEDDHEVRAVIDDPQIKREQAKEGLVVRILPHTLVETVVMAPSAPEWFWDTVLATCRTFRLDVPVERSALDWIPRLPL